jgi:prepilin-type N-terminal cleavage/methylation domain-containing protein
MKSGFTLVETLIVSSIMGMVLLIGSGIVSAVSSTIYNGQTESSGRISLSDNIYYLTRELQSAEAVTVSADGKLLKIKQRGSSDYSLEYEIKENYPVSYFCFKDKNMFAVDYESSLFAIDGKSISVKLAIFKNNAEPNQMPQITTVYVTPRSETAILEVENET